MSGSPEPATYTTPVTPARTRRWSPAVTSRSAEQLQRGQAALHDQRPGARAAPVRHVVEHQPGAGPSRGGEPPGQHPLPGREQRHREPRDRLIRAAEQLRRIGAGHQRQQHQRWLGRHRAERADRGPDVVPAVGHRHQRDRARPGRPRPGEIRRCRGGKPGPFGQLMIQRPGRISGPYGDRPAWAANRQAGPQASAKRRSSAAAAAGRDSLDSGGRSWSSGVSRG